MKRSRELEGKSKEAKRIREAVVASPFVFPIPDARRVEEKTVQAVGAQAAPTTLTQLQAKLVCPQLTWSAVWKMYRDLVCDERHSGPKNPPNGLYDLIVATSFTDDQNPTAQRQYRNFSPLAAMARAKEIWEALPPESQEASHKCKWKWSPQSRKTLEELTTHYHTLDSAFEGWRWFPEPAPNTKSHKHRWYPPLADVVMLLSTPFMYPEFCAVGALKADSSGHYYLTSPMATAFLKAKFSPLLLA